MLTKEQRYQLEQESVTGRRALHVYDSYLKKYIDDVVKSINDRFSSCDIDDTITLTKCKYELTAINSLQDRILSDIDTGKLAINQLESEHET